MTFTINGTHGSTPTYGLSTDSTSKTTKTSATPLPPTGAKLSATNGAPALLTPQGKINPEALQGSALSTASFGAQIMVMIQQATAEMIRDNREVTYQADMDKADLTEQQAKTMRDQAIAQIVLGVLSGTVQIAGGLFQAAASGYAMQHSADLALSNTKITGIGQIFSASSNLIETANKSAQTFLEADIKDLEAKKERLDAMSEQVKSITDSMQQTLHQSIDSLQMIATGMVETNKKILG